MPFPPLCESLFKPRIRDTPTSMPHKSCVKKTLGIKTVLTSMMKKKKILWGVREPSQFMFKRLYKTCGPDFVNQSTRTGR